MARRRPRRIVPEEIRERRSGGLGGGAATGADRIQPGDKFFHPYFEGRNKGTHLWFDNVEEFIEHVTPLSEKFSQTGAYCSSRSRQNIRQDWDFSVGWEGANKLAREGWSEGAEQVESLLDKVEGEIRKLLPMQRNTMRPAMVGGRVSVPAFLAGHPRQFLTLKREAATCKTITMAVNVGASCTVSAETMMRRGVAIAAVVRALEQRRVRVELVATITSYDKNYPGGCIAAAITIKRAADKLQADTVAFALAHFSFARRIGFACFEAQCIENGWNLPDDYGCPGPLTLPDAENVDTVPCYTDADMQEYVKTQLAKIIAS